MFAIKSKQWTTHHVLKRTCFLVHFQKSGSENIFPASVDNVLFPSQQHLDGHCDVVDEQQQGNQQGEGQEDSKQCPRMEGRLVEGGDAHREDRKDNVEQGEDLRPEGLPGILANGWVITSPGDDPDDQGEDHREKEDTEVGKGVDDSRCGITLHISHPFFF